MKTTYINFYNNLIKLTKNKELYQDFTNQDTFADRLTMFLFHFAFFNQVFKDKNNAKILQEIYDFSFRQIELSIREIGYGDQSINKKMKDYINIFHSILSDVHFWDDLSNTIKKEKLSKYFINFEKIDHLLDYFDNFKQELLKKTLNSYLKSVSNP
tara:strand:+ start:700 stop:1167 length:468 start_codon:yes stop_codon:yes gene_type:complete